MSDVHQIFDRALLQRRRDRVAESIAQHAFLLDRFGDDVEERLSLIQRTFSRVLILGAHHGELGRRVARLPDIETVIETETSLSLLHRCGGLRVLADEGKLGDLFIEEGSKPYLEAICENLVGNLIAMNEILGDHRRTSIRLVMNPDRMVIREAQRTFTYLNLYGYLTDAVVVNRVFPEDVADSYFAAWRERQSENLELVREGFGPVPLLTARYFDEEVLGARMLDRLGSELFADSDPAAVLHDELAHRIGTHDGKMVLSIRVPFADRDELTLKKVGQELIVRAGREKRTIILPPALSRHRPSGAKLEGGNLEVSFEDERQAAAGDTAAAQEPTPTAGAAGA